MRRVTQQVLVPIDGSDGSWTALTHAAERHNPAAITLLYVIDPLDGDYEVDASTENPVKRSEQVEAETSKRLREAGVDPADTTFLTREGRPADEILAVAEADEIDQVVMGSRGLSGVRRLLLGSVAETVVRRANVPVNVVR
jgi:nucleotide-binding universal stress UspA family protein